MTGTHLWSQGSKEGLDGLTPKLRADMGSGIGQGEVEKDVSSPLSVPFPHQEELTLERYEILCLFCFLHFLKILECNMPAGEKEV